MSMRDIAVANDTVRFNSLSSGSATLTAVLSKAVTTGVVTTGSSNVQFIDTNLSNVNTYLGRMVHFTSGSLVGDGWRYVSAYTVSSQTIVVTKPFSGTPATNDTFEFAPLIPTGANKVLFLALQRHIATGVANAPGITVSATSATTGKRILMGLGTGDSTGRADYMYPPSLSANEGDITVAVVPSTSYAAVAEVYLQILGI